MPYHKHYEPVDRLIKHMDGFVPNLDDLGKQSELKSYYAGLLCVAIVAVYEQAIKDIMLEFAAAQHPMVKAMTEKRFDRLRGKITIQDIKGQYLGFFGDDTYKDKFDETLEKCKKEHKDAYNDLITWRHQFVHADKVQTFTYKKVTEHAQLGRKVITCLHNALQTGQGDV